MKDGKVCESCGMPMRTAAEFGGGLEDNRYCVHCTDEQGTLLPKDVILNNMKNFAMRSMGVSEGEALKMAQEGMAKNPAWQ